jgi:acetoacetyl-CoA synthetase
MEQVTVPVDPDNLSKPLWMPPRGLVESCNITKFARHVRTTHGLDLTDYEALWRWSVSDLPGFWAAIWEFFGLDAISDYDDVLDSAGMPGARWFSGAHVNFADRLLAVGGENDPAIVSVDESGNATEHTRAELRAQANALARSLTDAGIGRGDVVVGYLPNCAEAVIAMLASAMIGAVWSSVGLDYAAQAVIDRFAQLRPKALIAADGYRFNGKVHERTAAVDQIRAALDQTLEFTILITRLGTRATPGMSEWSSVTARGSVESQMVDFDHPLWVLFSSGTTGVPKGLVHSHGGALVETLKQMGLHWNLGDSDRVFWYTSPSWVMWNLQLSTLLLGGSILCYDGSPTHPDASALWRLVSDHGVTFFGASPGYLQASAKAGISPAKQFDMSRLRAMGSTGSPLPPDLHRWAYDVVGPLPLWSMSGGTDIAGAFCGGAPTVPIWPGELSCRCLGVAVDAWNPEGQPLRDEVGELVVTKPMPSMPIKLWNDPSGQKYRDAYFSMFKEAWRQGDWVTITSRNSVVIHGRSDSTLNRNGVRMGSGEIYAAVEALPEVTEALILGVEQPDGAYWMPLFAVLAEGATLDDSLITSIRDAISRHVSPRHTPDEVIAVPGIPHTRTGKKLEIPTKRLFQGASLESVVNPDAVDDIAFLDHFVGLARTRLATAGDGASE